MGSTDGGDAVRTRSRAWPAGESGATATRTPMSTTAPAVRPNRDRGPYGPKVPAVPFLGPCRTTRGGDETWRIPEGDG